MCTKCGPNLNTDQMEAFGGRLVEMLNGAGLAMMLSIGHRTRLFDIMANMSPSTSGQIADAANLNERYVREWLGAMVTGKIVSYDPADQTYSLPPEHAALLTRAADENMAATMQWMAVLGGVETKIVESFRQGGGVQYTEFARFHEVMAEESNQTVVAALLTHILPLVPGIEERLEAGIDVADIGCGSGRALIALAERFRNSRFTGIDFSEEAIIRANDEAMRRDLTNVRFVVRDAAAIGMPGRFDLITAFDSIHDQKQPTQVLAEIEAALRDDGTFLMQDIRSSSQLENNLEHPIAPFLFTISTMHCMTVSLALGGAGLGTCWGVELAESMLRDAGFGEIEVHELEHDIMNSYFVAQKAAVAAT